MLTSTVNQLKSLEYLPPYCPNPIVSNRKRWTNEWAYGFGSCYPLLPATMIRNEFEESDKCSDCMMMMLATRAHYLCCASQSIPIDLISSLFNTIACVSYSSAICCHGVVCFPCFFSENGREGLEAIASNCSKIAFNYFKLVFTTFSSSLFHTALLPFNLVCTEWCAWQYSVDLKIYEVSNRAEKKIDDLHNELKNGYHLLCPSCCKGIDEKKMKISRESSEYSPFTSSRLGPEPSTFIPRKS